MSTAAQLAQQIKDRLAAGLEDDTDLSDEQVEKAALLLRPGALPTLPSQREDRETLTLRSFIAGRAVPAYSPA